MVKANSKTLVAGALAATVAFVAIGCGDGKNRPAPVRRSGMPSGLNKAGTATNGTVESTTQGGTGGGGTNLRGSQDTTGGKQAGAQRGSTPNAQGKGTPQASKADPNEAEIQKQEDQLKAGVPITREQMPSGTFRLESAVTSVFVSNNNVFARAIQSNRVQESGGGFQLQSASKLASGFLPSHTDDGRVVDIPFQFEVANQNGKWSTANAVPVAIRSYTTTETGKLEITDRMSSASGGASNILNIISANTITDRTYVGKDEAQKKLEVNLYKIDDQTLRVFISIEELLPAGVDKNGTQSVTFYRNFFLTYKVTAANAAAGTTP